MRRTHSWIVFLLIVFSVSALAQKKTVKYTYQWRQLEDSLEAITKRTVLKNMQDGMSLEEDSIAVRIVAKMLASDPELRFDFKEENLFIKALYNPEKTFRIVTWLFMQAPGYLIYRGVVQRKGKRKLIPLFDQTRFLKDKDNGHMSDAFNTPNEWYGAFYYKIIPYSTFTKKEQEKERYLLLGKKQSYILYDARVAEIMTLNDDGSVSFGGYFEAPRNETLVPSSKRFIMLYKKNAGAILDFHQKKEMIVFDELTTEKEEERRKLNNKIYLIPAGSYHGFTYDEEYDSWIFQNEAFKQYTPREFLLHQREKKKQERNSNTKSEKRNQKEGKRLAGKSKLPQSKKRK